jgi:hypothetical protein
MNGERVSRPRLRDLRIAFSAVCAVACLSLVAFSAWSYQYWGDIFLPLPAKSAVRVKSAQGQIAIWPCEGDYRFSDFRFLRGRIPKNRQYVGHTKVMSHYISWRGFHFRGTSVYIPIWCPVAVAAFFTTLPWIRWRFGLKSLLIGMTLLAGAMRLLAV